MENKKEYIIYNFPFYKKITIEDKNKQIKVIHQIRSVYDLNKKPS